MVTCSLWYPFSEWKTTYDLRFSIASSADFGAPLTIVLSTARSLFTISSRRRASSSLLSPTAWYNSQPVLQDTETTTHNFYFDDHFSNGEYHPYWIGIDTVRHLLEDRLHKLRSHFKMVFCNCLLIWDLRLRIRSCNSQCRVGFAVRTPDE